MSKYLFSIIIPTKNPNLGFFKESFLSVENQTFRDFEIIIVANGCDEEHIVGIQNIIATYNNVSLLFNNQIGLSRARNFGLKHTKGQYIIFVDDDDAVSIDFLETAHNLILKYDCDFLTFKDTADKEILKQNIKAEEICFSSNQIKNIFLGNDKFYKPCELRTACSKVYKLDVIKKNNLEFVHNLPAEDIEFVLRYSFHSKKMVVVNKYGYFYRYRPESISHRCDDTIIDRFDLLHKTFDEDLTNNCIGLHYLYFHILNYSIYNIAISYLFHKENKLSIFKETRILRKLCKSKYYRDAIKIIKIKEMFTKKKKLVLFLLKIHFYFTVSLLLSWRYKR